MTRDIDTGTDKLLCSVTDGVAVITLNRPEARNALSTELTPALRSMIKRMGDDPAIGAMIITGAGKAFCAGGDVKSMAAGGVDERTDDQKVADLIQRQRELTGALVAARKPTIAALPGAAAGAGLALALACDIRIMADTALVSTGYARVGLTGDYGIAWLLTRLVGTSRARELMFTAERVDAARCEALGIANHVVPAADLMSQTMDFAGRVAKGPRAALAAIKDNLDEALTCDFLTALDGEAPRMIQAFQSADHKEAARAFVEKREPKFGVG
jgi:enoyl-CoA hydratase/carnithine racemase